MNKTKTVLALVFTVLAVVLGGFLPRLSVLATDYLSRGRTADRELKPMQVEFSDREAGSSLTTLGRLSLMRDRGKMMGVSEGIMRSTAEDVWTGFKKELGRYFDAGLFPQMTECLRKSVTPGLMFDAHDSGLCDLFWLIQVDLSNGEDRMMLTGLMNDMDGKIYSIYFTTFNDNRLREPGKGTVEDFCQVFFEGLGVEPVLTADSRITRIYQLTDPEFGVTQVEIRNIRDEHENLFHMDIY